MISFVETKLFTRLVSDLLGDDEYALLQQALIANPELGDVIPGSGGVRKMRWGLQAAANAADFGSSTICAPGKAKSGCLPFIPRT